MVKESNLKKAKQVKEILKNSDLPKDAQNIGIMGVLMGANPDSIIKNMVSITDNIETKKAEKSNPKQDVQLDYNETEKVIADMLTENTGVHMLDSGGAYGRAWQRNRQIADFRENPEVSITTWKDGDTEISIDIFHYLTAFLEIDEVAEDLNKKLEEFADLEENKDLSWLRVMKEFAEKITSEYGFKSTRAWNSYNYDNLLSQVIQEISLYRNNDEYWILQIHGGCDIRGGYTKPKIFRVIERDYIIMAQSNINAYCECTRIYSDDCGYNWYDDLPDNKMPKYWKPKPKHKDAKNDEYQLVCSKCKKNVEFQAMLQY